MLADFSFGVCGLKTKSALSREERAISLVVRPAASSIIPNAAYKKVMGLHGARVVVRSLSLYAGLLCYKAPFDNTHVSRPGEL
jgi:hypothetical protein